MRAFKSSALGESGICSTRHSRPLHRHGFTLSLLLKPRSSEEPAGDGRCQDSRPKGIPLLSFCPQLSISETQTFSPSLIPASLGCCTQDKVPGPDMWKEHDALKPRPAPSLGLPAVAGRRAEARETPPLPHTAWQTVAEPSCWLSAGHNKSPCPSASSPSPPPALFG